MSNIATLLTQTNTVFAPIIDNFFKEIKADFSQSNIDTAFGKAMDIIDKVAKITTAAATVAQQVAPFTGPYAAEVTAAAAIAEAAGPIVEHVAEQVEAPVNPAPTPALTAAQILAGGQH
jgi:hypothetical protein